MHSCPQASGNGSATDRELGRVWQFGAQPQSAGQIAEPPLALNAAA